MYYYNNFYGLVAAYPIIALLIGLAIWIFGWKIFNIFIIIVGAVFGAVLLPQLVQISDSNLTIVLAIVGGVLGAVLAFFAMFAIVFLYGLFVGIGISTYYLGIHSQLISLAIGLALGIVFVMLYKFMVVFITSMTGSYLMAHSLLAMTRIHITYLLLQVVVAVLTVIGIILQYSVWGMPGEDYKPRLRRVGSK